MKQRKIRLIILCVLLSALSLNMYSCMSRQVFADDVSCSDLMDTVETQLPVEFGYKAFGEEHLRYYFEDTKLPDDLCLRYSTASENINEIGIFHTPDAESQEEVVELAEAYLEELQEDQRAFIGSYAPQELPKLDRAEVRTFGNYTVYAILSDEDRALAFDIIESVLEKK